MYFGNFRDYSVKIGNYKKRPIPSGKCRVLSVSGRHNDDRLRNAPGVFRKAVEAFYNFRSLPTSHGDCRSPIYPCYVKCEMLSTDDVTASDDSAQIMDPTANEGIGNQSCAFIKMPDIRQYSASITGDCNICSDREVCVVGSSSCAIKECRPLKVNHGQVKGNMLDIGSKVVIVCDEWHRLEPETSKSVCQANGNWSNVPECVIDTGCGYAPDDLPNADMKGYERMPNNSVYAVYNCSSGYNVPALSGTLYVECQAGGTWATNDSRCLIECGPPPVVTDATVGGGGTLGGDWRGYTCQGALVLLGSGSTECTYNGTWTPVDFQCVVNPCLQHSFPLAWGDSCYKPIAPNMDLDDATSYCQSTYNGSYLLQIETEEEFNYIRHKFRVTYGALCLGLRKQQDLTWIWQGTNSTPTFMYQYLDSGGGDPALSYAVVMCEKRGSWWSTHYYYWWAEAEPTTSCKALCELRLKCIEAT